ncbi:MAG: DUF2807 domain-containing protein [Salinivirgaceae bacterium]|nr:DUF2807 domain-containing protein [Salinivirgaceae bacterium]
MSPDKNKIELHIHYKSIREIYAHETCNIQTKNPITSNSFGLVFESKANEANLELDCGTFYYWNNFPCGGKLTLYGHTKELKLWNYALTTVDAYNLFTSFAIVENSSKGDCIINVAEELNYAIKGEGNIVLFGNPGKINETETGTFSTGKLIIR